MSNMMILWRLGTKLARWYLKIVAFTVGVLGGIAAILSILNGLGISEASVPDVVNGITDVVVQGEFQVDIPDLEGLDIEALNEATRKYANGP